MTTTLTTTPPPRVGSSCAAPETGLASAQVAAMRAWMAGIDQARGAGGVVDPDAERIAVITELELLKNAITGAQARVTVAFADSQVAGLTAAGVDEAAARRSVGSQVALARRESPSRGDRHVGLARAMVTEMPHTMAAVTAGVTSEWRATLIAQGTACLTKEDRAIVDERLADDAPKLGDRQLKAAVARLAAELDPASVVRARARANGSRRVSVRPAVDGMAYLSVFGSLTDCVGAYASLGKYASAVAGGYHPDEAAEGRTKAQVMADAALRLLSGRAVGQPQPVEVDVIITDTALFGQGPGRTGPEEEPALVAETYPVPAAWARDLLWNLPDEEEPEKSTTADHNIADSEFDDTDADGNAEDAAEVPEGPDTAETPGGATGAVSDETHRRVNAWLRRLYTSPDGRNLVAMDSKRRVFTGSMRKMLILRDKTCRTPWCDAPIRDLDHATPHSGGGPTNVTQGNGRCQRCNLVKETPGWRVQPLDPATLDPLDPPGAGGARAGPHTLALTTPTGVRHVSQAPPILGWGWHANDDVERYP